MSSRLIKGVAALALAMPIAVAGLSSPAFAQTDPCGAITDEARCAEGGMDLKLDQEPRTIYRVSGSTTVDDTDADLNPQEDATDTAFDDSVVVLCDSGSGGVDSAVSYIAVGARVVVGIVDTDGRVIGYAASFPDAINAQGLTVRCADDSVPPAFP